MKKVYDVYAQLPLIVRLYVKARVAIAGFQQLFRYLPKKGTVLDIGCGYGVLLNALSVENSDLTLYGIDIDARRIAVADKTIGERKNIHFAAEDVTQNLSFPHADAVILYDLLHHIPQRKQKEVLMAALKAVKKGGALYLKDIDTKPRPKFYINLAHDKLLNGGPLYYRHHTAWARMISKAGYSVETKTFGTFYPHMLLIARRK